MKYIETKEIALKDIVVGSRLRPINQDKLEVTQASMAEIGQSTPIEVVREKSHFLLIAGNHRITAAKNLGWSHIRAEIKQPLTNKAELEHELHEIDENLGRNELNALDRAVSIGRRMEIQQLLYPDAGQGGDRKSADFQEKKSKGENRLLIGLLLETAEKAGLGETTLKRALRIYRNLPADIRTKLGNTKIAESEGELYALAKHAHDDQKKIVGLLLAKADPAPSVAVAAARLSGKPVKEKSKHEKDLAKLQESWDRSGKRTRVAFLNFLKDELDVVKTFNEANC